MSFWIEERQQDGEKTYWFVNDELNIEAGPYTRDQFITIMCEAFASLGSTEKPE